MTISELLQNPEDRKAAKAAANWLKRWVKVSRGGQIMTDVTLRAIAEIEQQTPVSIPRPIGFARKGLHGRNSLYWEQADYDLVKTAKIETLKMMSDTSSVVFRRLHEENPLLQFITRLRDDRFSVNHHPSPQEFVSKMSPVISSLKEYCIDYEIHNEPGHPQGYEGWWLTNEDAEDFNRWFRVTLNLLRANHPWARFGFPGLAIPHRDLEWLHICKPAIDDADWLGVHSYWEYDNHLNPDWGLRFEKYRDIIPNKLFHITEAGNAQQGLKEEVYAQQVVEFYRKCREYPYIGSVCFFIMSSPDPTWDRFTWREENGRFKEVVKAVGQV